MMGTCSEKERKVQGHEPKHNSLHADPKEWSVQSRVERVEANDFV